MDDNMPHHQTIGKVIRYFLILVVILLLCSCIRYPEPKNSISISTIVLSSNATSSNDNNSCNKDKVTSYLKDVDTAINKANQLAYGFGQTQNREQATEIVNEMDNLFQEVSLWKTPDCAKEVQINLQLVIVNLASGQHALLNNDMDSFNRDYQTYEIALNQLNVEIQKLKESVK